MKAVLFDFDGTLVDSNEAVVSILHQAAIHHRGTAFNDEELQSILGKPLVDQMAFLSEVDKDELVRYYRAAYQLIRDEKTFAYPGVNEMLARLKAAGVKIGIVSNKGRNGIDHGIALLGLGDYIDASVSKDDVVLSKPNPEGVFIALSQMGLCPEDAQACAFVGDSGHDIETGKNAGMKTVLVDWTLIDKDKLLALKPDYVAMTPEDIANYVLSEAKV